MANPVKKSISKESLSQPEKKGSGGYVNIAQSLIDQMSKAGQPRTSTTTITQPEEPMNLMNLGLIAMMLLESYLNKPKTTPGSDFTQSLLPTQIPPERPMDMPNMPFAVNSPAPSPTGQLGSGGYGSMNPMQIIQAILGAKRGF